MRCYVPLADERGYPLPSGHHPEGFLFSVFIRGREAASVSFVSMNG